MSELSKRQNSIIEKDWKHAGLRCVVVFVRQTHRCGYVAVPEGNPAFDISYNNIPVTVHGGEWREFAVPENMSIRSGDRFVICEGKN